jgi:hypothetical protein
MNTTHLNIKIHGIQDGYVTQGTPAELLEMTRLDGKGIAGVVKDFYLQNKQPTILPGRKAQ